MMKSIWNAPVAKLQHKSIWGLWDELGCKKKKKTSSLLKPIKNVSPSFLSPLTSSYEAEKLVKIHPNVPTSYWSQMMHERTVTGVWLLSCLPARNIDLRGRQLRRSSLVDGMMEGKAGWEGEEREVCEQCSQTSKGFVDELVTNCCGLIGDN